MSVYFFGEPVYFALTLMHAIGEFETMQDGA